MTEVINTREPTREDFTVGGTAREQGLSFQIFPDSHEQRYPKLSDVKRLPSIMVEPTEGEVESGELRWPPDNLRTTEPSGQTHTHPTHTPTSRDQSIHGQSADELQSQDGDGSSLATSGAAGRDSN